MKNIPKYIEVDDRLINEIHITQIIKGHVGSDPVLEIRFETRGPITVYYINKAQREKDFEMISGDRNVHTGDLHKTLTGVIGK